MVQTHHIAGKRGSQKRKKRATRVSNFKALVAKFMKEGLSLKAAEARARDILYPKRSKS